MNPIKHHYETASTGQTPNPVSVALLGFQDEDIDSFGRFFQTVRPFQRSYQAIGLDRLNELSILMVNYDNPAALSERDKLLHERPMLTVVAVSRGPLDHAPEHHIRGMLFASRVFSILDKIATDSGETAPIEPTASTVGKDSHHNTSSQAHTGHPNTPLVGNRPGLADWLTPLPQRETTFPGQFKPSTLPIIKESKVVDNPPEAELPRHILEIKPPLQSPSELEPSPKAEPVIEQGDAPTPGLATIPTAPPIPKTDDVVPPSTEAKIGYRALVVDDSIAIQKSLEINLATLPQIGTIDFAETGESALAKVEIQHYDLIFLDVMMPGIDGYETCTQLRKNPQYKKTPIIMVSGKTSPMDEVKGVLAGCTTYLTKPVQQEAFQKLGIRVLAWLEQQKNRNAPNA